MKWEKKKKSTSASSSTSTSQQHQINISETRAGQGIGYIGQMPDGPAWSKGRLASGGGCLHREKIMLFV